MHPINGQKQGDPQLRFIYMCSDLMIKSYDRSILHNLHDIAKLHVLPDASTENHVTQPIIFEYFLADSYDI